MARLRTISTNSAMQAKLSNFHIVMQSVQRHQARVLDVLPFRPEASVFATTSLIKSLSTAQSESREL